MKNPRIKDEHLDLIFLLRRFLEIGNLTLSETNVDQVFSTVMEGVIDVYGAERGMVLLFDNAGKTLCKASYKLSQDDLSHPDFTPSRSMIDEVRRHGNPICRCHDRGDPLPFSAICLPLRRKGEVFGLIYLDHQTGCGTCEATPCIFFKEFAEFFSLAVSRTLEQTQLRSRVHSLEAELRGTHNFESIIGHHPTIVEILQRIAQVAKTDATVLIQGESGTGKELVARALYDNSHRQDNPLIPVNCGALPEHLLESELFGHVRGAFTGAVTRTTGLFESANRGTIFLDEVNDMSPALQVKLLRVLQTGEYSRVGSPEVRHCDVRVIAASSQDLHTLVTEGTFREDVYYRLHIVDIQLPPLRERKCDIPLLARHFLKLYGAKYGKPDVHLSNEAEMLLTMYDFPGQVRELENMMQRVVIFADGETIPPEHLAAHVFRGKNASWPHDYQPTFQVAKKQVVEQFERDYLVDCLQATQGNISHAARTSGLHVTNLYTKMKKYAIHPHTFKV